MTAQIIPEPGKKELVAVPDGDGGTRHVWRAVREKGGKKKRHAPDPIHANPDASAQQLRLIVERIERMNEEIDGAMADRKDIYAEAKAIGFDPKVIRGIVAMRKIDPHTRMENEALLETYKAALGLD